GTPAGRVRSESTHSSAMPIGRPGDTKATSTSSASRTLPVRAPLKPLPKPTALVRFGSSAAGKPTWRAAGRRVHDVPAISETTLVPPGASQPAGVAWMDTRLLAARLYSGSQSPGGGPYRYTAPIRAASARHLVAAFNGGFKMKDAHGGYYTQGRLIDPLR